ncbi:MAG: DUF814 domain-containing protein, partial [Deltaproteobacteria bacterium]|nr:DUF814 domain-containing protein [Deltaproteobacteria bacterium]
YEKEIYLSLNVQEIESVCLSLDNDLKGGVVRKVISTTDDRAVCIIIRTPSTNHYLNITLKRSFCRIGRMENKPVSAKEPSAFVMLLRKNITGATVQSVAALNNDRVVKIIFAHRDKKKILIGELTDKSSNLFLTDEKMIIAESFFENRSSKRELAAGKKYVLPFSNPAEAALKQSVSVLSPDTDTDAAIESTDKLFEKEYEKREQIEFKKQQKEISLKVLKSKQQKKIKLLKNLNKDLQKADAAVKERNSAYVLQANLGQIKKGTQIFTAKDFENNEVEIRLNPALTAVENMQLMFKKAHKYEKAEEFITGRIINVEEELEQIEKLIAEIESLTDENADDIFEEVRTKYSIIINPNNKKKSEPEIRIPYKVFEIFNGHTARVGRSSKDNDELTLHHTAPSDLWLHAKGVAGSHVTVPLKRGEEPSQDLLIDAAHLAVYYSKARNQTFQEVSYTFKRYVQKPKGAPRGMVRLIKEKIITLRIDQQKLNQILNKILL